MSREDQQKWDNRYGESLREGKPLAPPASWIEDHLKLLPSHGFALEVAGGTGRHSILLAKHGLSVTLSDISPVGLELATQHAEAAGVSLATCLCDFEHDPLPTAPSPTGKWDVITSAYYLWRGLFAIVPDALAPGGWFIYTQPTLKNLERHEKPPASFVLKPGELISLVEGFNNAGLEIVELVEDWNRDNRHEASLVARKPAVH